MSPSVDTETMPRRRQSFIIVSRECRDFLKLNLRYVFQIFSVEVCCLIESTMDRPKKGELSATWQGRANPVWRCTMISHHSPFTGFMRVKLRSRLIVFVSIFTLSCGHSNGTVGKATVMIIASTSIQTNVNDDPPFTDHAQLLPSRRQFQHWPPADWPGVP